MPASAWWIFLIVVGAAIVAISNIYYNRAIESENRAEKAIQVRELLRTEIQKNREVFTRINTLAASKTISLFETFDTTAWQTVSSSGLLLGLPNNELEKLLQTYSLMNLANSLRSKFLDSLKSVKNGAGGTDHAA